MDGDSRKYDKLESILQDGSSRPLKLPLEYLKKITNSFSNEKLLGEGGFSKVYEGVLQDGKLIAVKRLDDQLKPGVQEAQYENEVYHLIRLRHPNIIQFVGYCYETVNECVKLDGKYVFAGTHLRFLCLEYLPNGSLAGHLSDESSGLDWCMRYKIINGICRGLHYLHEECQCKINASIIHMDLKPANILLDDNMVPKIADFGLSKLFDDKKTQTRATNLMGTIGYMAPEYIYRHIITAKTDIYSLGVIIIEIITGAKFVPYSFVTSHQDFVQDVLQNWRSRPEAPPSATDCQQIESCLEIGLSCIKINQNERPTTREIIERLNRWEINNCNVSNVEMATADQGEEKGAELPTRSKNDGSSLDAGGDRSAIDVLVRNLSSVSLGKRLYSVAEIRYLTKNHGF